MSVDLSALSLITTTATALSNLILVTPTVNKGIQPQSQASSFVGPTVQIPKFLFNYEGENAVTLESDITDHYAEDNTAIQDQIALKPEMITTHGFIGELNDIVPPLLEPLLLAADKLFVLSAYTPELSETALLLYNEAIQAYQVATLVQNAAVSAWQNAQSSATGLGAVTGGSVFQTKQQQAFMFFYGYWKNRTLFTVQTPWAVFKDMAIKSLRFVQDADTRMITDIEVSFKKMQFASTFSNLSDLNTFQQRAKNQAAGLIQNGSQSLFPGPTLASVL